MKKKVNAPGSIETVGNKNLKTSLHNKDSNLLTYKT